MLEVASQWWAWAILAVLLLLGELLFIGFYLLPLGVAAAVAALAAAVSPLPALPYGWLVPCAVFLVASPILLLTLRPFMVRTMYGGGQALNLDALVQREARVLEAINPATGQGQVRIERETWAASSADGVAIPAGATVTVTEIKGNRAVVKPKT
jgi:membrane protein implicated in regulation of membrane protease activity